MILTVEHTTAYSYDRPMRQLVQSLRLFPSICDSQTVLDWDVSVEGFADLGQMPSVSSDQSQQMEEAAGGWLAQPQSNGSASGAGAQSQAPGQMAQSMGGRHQSQTAQAFSNPRSSTQKPLARGINAGIGAAFRDGAGDRVETASVRGPVSRVVITVSGRVETRDTSGILRGHRETAVPGLYLRSTRATEADIALTELGREVIARQQGKTPLSLAHALSSEVSERIAYAPGETSASTTAAEALARGKGVCQDHAHALISLAHLSGIPARYVVGYLATEGAIGEASHAWAELFLDGFGWIGFDPANRCCPDQNYIRLCSGYDAQDAAPIRGVASGAEAEHLAVDVAVRRLPA